MSFHPRGITEVIVVDDRSPDGTYERVRDSFAGDPRVIAVLRDDGPRPGQVDPSGDREGNRGGDHRDGRGLHPLSARDPEDASSGRSLRHRDRVEVLCRRADAQHRPLHREPLLQPDHQGAVENPGPRQSRWLFRDAGREASAAYRSIASSSAMGTSSSGCSTTRRSVP